MFNWFTKGIATATLILSMSGTTIAQNMEQIISEYHQGDEKITALTLQQAIDKGLENREDIYRINITKDQSSSWITYEKQRLNGIKLNANAGLGYNILDNKSKPYIAGGINLTLPTYSPDNRKLIDTKEIQEEIAIIRTQAYIAEATSQIIHQFIDIKTLEAKLENNKFFIKHIDSIKNCTKNEIILEISDEKIKNYINELKDESTSIKIDLENKRASFNSTIGLFSNEKIYLLDRLLLPNKQLFENQNTTENDKQKSIEYIAAATVIIRTESWKLEKDIAILNYQRNSNIEFAFGGGVQLRREQFPEESNYAPTTANASIALGGTGKKSLREIAQGEVQLKESYIREYRNTNFQTIIKYFSEMNEAIDKATPERKNRFKTEFNKSIINYCYNITKDTTLATQIVNEVIEASKHHRDSHFEYLDNISLSNHRAISIKWYVYFNENPVEYARILETREHKSMK